VELVQLQQLFHRVDDDVDATAAGSTRGSSELPQLPHPIIIIIIIVVVAVVVRWQGAGEVVLVAAESQHDDENAERQQCQQRRRRRQTRYTVHQHTRFAAPPPQPSLYIA